jgi:hypothetical protein
VGENDDAGATTVTGLLDAVHQLPPLREVCIASVQETSDPSIEKWPRCGECSPRERRWGTTARVWWAANRRLGRRTPSLMWLGGF